MGIFDGLKKEKLSAEVRKADIEVTDAIERFESIVAIMNDLELEVPDLPALEYINKEITSEAVEVSEEEEVVEYDFPGRGPADATVAFVGMSPGQVDAIRKRPLSGIVGKTFEESYLPHLGLGIDDVYITNIVKEHCVNDAGKGVDPTSEQVEAAWSDFVQEIKEVNPRFIVALGKAAKDVLGDAAQEHVPHPRALNINHDSGEVSRKMRRLAKAIAKPDYTIEGVVVKAEEEKQIVYSVVMEPFENDTDENWTSPEEIESAAHHFMKNYRLIDSEHSRVDIDATPVESWVVHEDTVIGGQHVRAGSWVMGAKVSDPEDWQKVKSGEWTGFSIDAVAHIDPNLLLDQ